MITFKRDDSVTSFFIEEVLQDNRHIGLIFENNGKYQVSLKSRLVNALFGCKCEAEEFVLGELLAR